MARDATARLYDVDEDRVVFKKLQQTGSYDQGTIEFRAREGKLIDLDKLHESIWATRLSGGTRSGLVSLKVTAIGSAVPTENQIVLKVPQYEATFLVKEHPDEQYRGAFEKLQESASGSGQVRLTGEIENYRGRWPEVLRQRPPQSRSILVMDVEVVE